MPRDIQFVPRRGVHLHWFLIIPFVAQIFVAVGLTGWISLYNGQKAVNELAARLQEQASYRIAQQLENYLENSQVINRINAEAIAIGRVDLQDPDSLTQHFWQQRFLFDAVCGSAIYFGSAQGEFTGLSWQDNDWLIGRVGKSTQGKFHRYASDRQGKAIDLVRIFGDYDPRTRPWYQAAVATGGIVWSSPYPDYSRQDMKLALAQPLYDSSGNLQGVIGVDCLLSSIGQFLKGIEIGQSGKTLILDRSGRPIATSSGQIPFEFQRRGLKALESDDPFLRALGRELQQRFGDLDRIRSKQQFQFQLENQRQLVQVAPFSAEFGLDWLIIVVVPESDFMATINANTQIAIILCLVALAIATAVGLLTVRWLVQPIGQTIHAADALSRGQWDRRVPESIAHELALLASAFNRMAQQLRESFRRLEYQANYDNLTGLLNRTAFRLKLQEAIAHRSSVEESDRDLFALLFLDLDDFKRINDSLGHLAGDRLLFEVAERLKRCMGSTGAIARFGGDEFTILLKGITDPEEVYRIAEQILAQFQQPFDLDSRVVFTTASMGIVFSTAMGDHPENFLRDADIALYRAKSTGKATYKVFNVQMYADVSERLQLEIDLRSAIEKEEFVVYYQPIIDIQTQHIVGFEALVRWLRPTGALISPAQFIPIAEETGLIIELGAWILRSACARLRYWQQQFALSPDIFISVNLSGKQFLYPNLLNDIEQILLETGLPPHNLKLEITESMLVERQEATISKLEQLVALGIQFSIDDFGTGYSSLSYLHSFPIHIIKIDRSFVSCLNCSDEKSGIVETIVVLAQKLGMNTVAEGVETLEQLEQLRKMGCQQVQGYLFSPPVAADQIAELLDRGCRIVPKLPG